MTFERPLQVTKAVYILYFSLVSDAASLILEIAPPKGDLTVGVTGLALLPLIALLYYQIGKGKNWARMAYGCLYFLGIFLTVIDSINKPPFLDLLGVSQLILQVISMVLGLVAVVLLFQPESTAWFKAVSAPLRNPFIDQQGYRRNPLKIILPILRNTDQPIFNYVWKAWLIDIIPAFLIVSILGLFLPVPEFPIDDLTPFEVVLLFLVFAPWLETLIMWPVLAILKRMVKNTLWVALASAVIFGYLHTIEEGGWLLGFSAGWGFFVFSLCFVEWKKISTGRAITVTALVHMCSNAIPALCMVTLILSGEVPRKQETMGPISSHQKTHVTVSASKKTTLAGPSAQVNTSKEAENLIRKARYKSFQKAFPGYGESEFELAYEDLWPDWKKKVAPNGEWKEFLSVYKEFIQWWKNRGSPYQSGLKLWNDFLARKK